MRQLTQSTNLLGVAQSAFPSITDDGALVFFHSDQSKGLQVNADASLEIWRVRADGSGGLTALTNYVGALAYTPVVSGSGNRVAFAFYGSSCSGAAGSPAARVCAMDGSGGSRIQLLELVYKQSSEPDGSRVVFTSDGDLAGSDPDRGVEIYTVRPDGSGLAQLTNLTTGGDPSGPSVSGDGQIVVFHHNGNDGGINPEGNLGIPSASTGTGPATRR